MKIILMSFLMSVIAGIIGGVGVLYFDRFLNKIDKNRENDRIKSKIKCDIKLKDGEKEGRIYLSIKNMNERPIRINNWILFSNDGNKINIVENKTIDGDNSDILSHKIDGTKAFDDFKNTFDYINIEINDEINITLVYR